LWPTLAANRRGLHVKVFQLVTRSIRMAVTGRPAIYIPRYCE